MRQMTATQIARVVHEANRALQIEQNDPTIPVSPSWDDLDDETRRSAVEGVTNILTGKVTTPEQSHVEWMRFKQENGWTPGPVKDEGKKEHPLLVPYRELPEDQRLKDGLFFAIVNALRPRKTQAQSFFEGVGGGRGCPGTAPDHR
jgi:hypothetical protein